ncbi:hypothetical protein AB1N83_008214, partial [Pleurotus pulmonarius]
RTRQILLV